MARTAHKCGLCRKTKEQVAERQAVLKWCRTAKMTLCTTCKREFLEVLYQNPREERGDG